METNNVERQWRTSMENDDAERRCRTTMQSEMSNGDADSELQTASLPQHHAVFDKTLLLMFHKAVVVELLQ